MAGDWIFTLTDDAKLLCMARANGKVRWLTQLARFRNEQKKKDQIFWSGPVLAGGRLWFTNSRGEVYSASVTDGRPQLVDSLGSPITLAPVVAGGRLYVLDDGGDITVYR